jgi:membrane protease YdiL (CAAX protease family)
MPPAAQMPMVVIPFWIVAVAVAAVLLSFSAWVFLGSRLLEGKPVLPAYQPRRRVPWTGMDLLLILFFFVGISIVIGYGFLVVEKVSGRQKAPPVRAGPAAEQEPAAKQEIEKKTTAHPLTQLLKEDKDPTAIAVAFAMGVVIAPLCEELLFRVLLLGWLESVERRWWRKLRGFLPALSRGMLPILFSSLMFAALHYREESPETEEHHLILGMVIGGLVYLSSVGFALWLVRFRVGATAGDLGWDADKIGSDLLTGVVAFFAVYIPLIVIQAVVVPAILPERFAPDPIAIFFLAIVLGSLYYRTHRLVPSLVVHVLLNGCSLAMVLFLAR